MKISSGDCKRWLALAVGLLLLLPSFAGEVVGRITALDRERMRIDIEDVEYVLPDAALTGSGPSGYGQLSREQLRVGQVVRFEAEGARVSRLNVLAGAKDVPH